MNVNVNYVNVNLNLNISIIIVNVKIVSVYIVQLETLKWRFPQGWVAYPGLRQSSCMQPLGLGTQGSCE